jgi:hypothetical protein
MEARYLARVGSYRNWSGQLSHPTNLVLKVLYDSGVTAAVACDFPQFLYYFSTLDEMSFTVRGLTWIMCLNVAIG